MEKRLNKILSFGIGIGIVVSVFATVKASTEVLTHPKETVAMAKELKIQTVKIERGDSLWALAKEYYTKDWGDFRDFVKQIKESNNLASDEIQAGNYIVIPHY